MARIWWLVLGAVACGGKTTEDSAPAPERVYSSDWDGVQALLTDHCVVCHVEGGQAEYLPLPESIGLDLVGGDKVLVVPGNPDASRLWLVIAGEVMPFGGPYLAPHERDHVRDWIAAGAAHPFDTVDFDGDGFSTAEGDCDERSAAVRPSAQEVCGDGLDNDCSGTADGPDAVNAVSWWLDGDGDGYGTGPEVVDCGPLSGHAAADGDCDDLDPAVSPGQPEVVDGVDQDCDGFVDETTSHAADVEPLYMSYCSCHVSGLDGGVLDLGPDAYANLVGVASTQLLTMNLVEPFDTDASYLWHKLVGTHLAVGGTGEQMPRAAPPLDPTQMAAIEAWILEGAPP